MKQIMVVGCGPGSPEYVTPAARRAVGGAELLVGSARLHDLFPESRAERIFVSADISSVLDEMASRMAGKKVAVMVTGDPGLCSLARPVIKRFGLERCGVVPGISSVQMAFAALGVEWGGARIISAHERLPDLCAGDLCSENAGAILMGGAESRAWVAELFEQMSGTHDFWVCENMSLYDERVYAFDADNAGAVCGRSVVVFRRREK